MSPHKHVFLSLFLGILAFASAATEGANAEDVIKVAVPQRGSWETSASELGQTAGIFAKHGLKLDILYTAGGGETMQALISGSVDIAVATGTTAMLAAYAKGAPVRPIASSITGAKDIFWYVPANSPITSLKQASGKTIGFSALGSSSNLATMKLIQLSGADIKAVPTGISPATFTQVMSGQIDIGWSAVPFALDELENKRIRLIASYTDIPEYRDMTARLHIANLAFITGRPDVLKRFLAAYTETLDWMYQGDAAVESFSKIYEIPIASTRAGRDKFYSRQALDLKRLSGLDQAQEDAVALKFLTKPLTKVELDDMFKYFDK